MRRTRAVGWSSMVFTVVVACTSASTAMPVVSLAPSSTPASGTAASATAGVGSSYVHHVSALCATLQTQTQTIVQFFPPHFPVVTFLADTARIEPLLHAFDTKLAAVPVQPADYAAAAAFAAYVKESFATRQLRIAAARHGQRLRR